MKANGFSAAADQGVVGHRASVRRLRVQQVARRRLRAGVVLDGLPQGQLSRPSTWPACSPRSATTRTRRRVYLADCRRLGITVLPPDVNESVLNFASVGADIRFGLGAVRNVGANVVASLINTRTEKGKYTDFSDYLNKIDITACNKKVTESLIKAGGVRLARASAQGPVPDPHRRRRLGARHQEGRGDGPVRPVRRRGHRYRRRSSPSRCPTRSGTTSTSWRSSGRCWGCTSPGTRSTGSRTCSPPRSTPTIPAILDGDVANDVAGARRRHPGLGEPAGEQERDALGLSAVGGPHRRHRGAVLPARVLHVRRGHRRRRRRAGRRRRFASATTGCR